MAEPHVIKVNESDHRVVSDPRTPLLDVLREELALTGTKDGCSEGECGACTVLVDGDARMACLTPLGTLAGREVTTIEGLRDDPIGERLVAAFGAAGAVQCGFCSPGFVVAARAGIGAGDASVLDMLRGNLCRCTGYRAIVEAVTEVASFHPHRHHDRSAPEERPVSLDPDDPRFVVPQSLTEACEAVARLGEDALVIAGGTGRITPTPGATPVWIGGLPKLSRIEPLGEFRIGAGVTWERLRTSGRIHHVLPALAQAAEAFGGPQIRNVATIGGNIALGSPGGDALPALAIHDASVELESTAGTRLVPLAEVAAGRRPDELITAVVIEHPAPDRLEFFVKVAPRKGRSVVDKVSVAFSAVREENRLTDVRIALGSAGRTVIRATAAEQLLTDSWVSAERIAAAAAAAEAVADPIDDVRPTADHRRRLVRGILTRELTRRLLL